MEPDGVQGPRRGRPIDPHLDDALRAATRELLSEYGWRGTTVEKIAERAGVARTTVYRRHGSVHGVLLLMMADHIAATPVTDTGSLRGDLIALARASVRTWRDPAYVDYLCALTAAQRENPEIGEAYRNRLRARRAATSELLDRAAARGEIRAGFDGELLLDLLAGVITFRALVRDAALSDEFADEAVDALLVGFAVA